MTAPPQAIGRGASIPQLQGPAGAQNVPNNLFGQEGFMSPGFSGYNANNANVDGNPVLSTIRGSVGDFRTPGGPTQWDMGNPTGGWSSQTYGTPNPWGLPQQPRFGMPTGPGGQILTAPQGFTPMGGRMPWQGQMMMPPAQSPGGFSPYGYSGYAQEGNGMSPNASPTQLLQATAEGYGAGAPVSALPAWQAMVNAQQHNIQTGADQLAEQFNQGDSLFSNAYGSAQGLYQEQARLGQNSQLTQAQLQSMLGAQQIQAGSQNELMNSYLQSLGLNLQSAEVGSQLGGQQYGYQQNDLNSQYTRWLNSQPYMNPFLQMVFSAATNYAPQQYQPGWFTSLLQAGGQAAGGAGQLVGALP